MDELTTEAQEMKGGSLAFLKRLLFLALIGAQFLIINNELGAISSIAEHLIGHKFSTPLAGDIFFSGNLRGTVFECIDCAGHKELMPKLSSLIRSYDGALFFDLGDFTSYFGNSDISSFYYAFFMRTHICAINLTKRDFPNVLKSHDLGSLPLVSSNIRDQGIGYVRSMPSSLLLRNSTEVATLELSIVGITDNVRYFNGEGQPAVDDEVSALNKVCSSLKGKIVLLYHNSEHNLRKLLERYSGPDLLFVVGCSADSNVGLIRRIRKTPYVFIGEGSQNIGHLRVTARGQNVRLSFRLIHIGTFLPDDPCILNLMDIMRDHLTTSK
jgi:hypothetical protein